MTEQPVYGPQMATEADVSRAAIHAQHMAAPGMGDSMAEQALAEYWATADNCELAAEAAAVATRTPEPEAEAG